MLDACRNLFMIYSMTARTPHPTAQPIRVGVQVSPEYAYGRQILEGIIRYSDEHGQWDFCSDRMYHKDFHRTHSMDAMIAEVRDPARASLLARLKMPVVAVTGHAATGKLPLVTADYEAIARLAAEHFQELGLEHWAYVGGPPRQDDRRSMSFCLEAERLGIKVIAYPDLFRPGASPRQGRQLMLRWLRKLPHPVGVFVAFDSWAMDIASLCHSDGIRIPEELALLGVSNDELLCRLSHPPLSSVDHNAFEIGYQAAALLDRMLAGEPIAEHTVLLPPLGVIRRQSTDITAVRDVEMVRALELIRQEACDGLTARDVARRVNVSRTRLEGLFQQWIGRSVHQEIIRIRLATARHLLRHTTLAMPEITVRCGVSYPSQLSHLFRKHFGVSPSQYRLRRGPEPQP